MKKNLCMQWQSSSSMLSLLLFSLAITLFLPGCCFFGPVGIAAAKPCNCKPGTEKNTVTQTTANASPATAHENSTGIYSTAVGSVEVSLAEPVNQLAPTAVVMFAGDATIPAPTGIQLTKVDYTDPLFTNLPAIKPGKQFAGKKLPLGIKSIQSYIIAGPNISFKSSKENYGSTRHKHKPGIGFQFGAGTSYFFSDNFAVAPSLLFKHNTASETIQYNNTGEPGSGTGQEYETKYSYSYLSVPILAELKLNEQLTVMAGPEVNLLAGANTKSKTGGATAKNSIKSSSVKTGVGVQAGVKYKIPGAPLGIQLIYDHRISRLNKKNSEYSTGGGGYTTPAWNMKSLQLTLSCAICELMKGLRK